MGQAFSRRQMLRAGGAALGLGIAGCRRGVPGAEPVPPGLASHPGEFQDISPRWSLDGGRVAFLRATPDRRYQLFTARADLSNAQPILEPEYINPDRPLRAGRAGYLAPDALAWSPDGARIAFPRVEWFKYDDGERLPGTSLWSVDLARSRAEPVAHHSPKYEDEFYYYRSPEWSPDGKRVALIAEAPDGSTALLLRDLHAMDAAMDTVRFDQYRDCGWPIWSPDGARLLFRQGMLRAPTADPIETLRLISPAGLEARRLFALTPIDYRAGFAEGRDAGVTVAPRFASPAWSPDGSRVAFTISPDVADRSRYAVYVMTIGSRQPPVRVSPQDGRGYLAPVWLDEEQLAACRPSQSGFEIVQLSPEPRALCRIPTDDFDWSPDRKWIAHAGRQGKQGLKLIRVGS